MYLILTTFAVCLGLVSTQPNNEVVDNGINNWRKTQQNVLSNFFNSIKKKDVEQSNTYHEILQIKTAKDQQVFDSMKTLLQSARIKKVNKFSNESGNTGNNNTVLKRETKEITKTPNKLYDLSLHIISLQKIRDLKKVYVDKTSYILHMLRNEGPFQLLIRPRRFGKTLLLNTIRDVLLGKQYLFKNMYIEDKYDWTIKYTVIKLEFVQGQSVQSICAMFELIAVKYNVELAPDSPIDKTDPQYFAFIINYMYQVKGYSNIVLLMDEYDLPLLTTGSDSLKYYMQFLRSLKHLLHQECLQYVIMTGCTSINNLQVKSGVNVSRISLTRELEICDLSMKSEFNGVCGYDREEIKSNYHHHIEEIVKRSKRTEEEVYEEIRQWYDGYMFCSDTELLNVYNPVSIMEYFKLKQFEGQSFWALKDDHPRLTLINAFEVVINQGEDLLDLQKKFTYNELYADNTITEQSAVNDVKSYMQKGSLESLLFQVGLLTITAHDSKNNLYILKIPNKEAHIEFDNIITEAMKNSEIYIGLGKEIVESFNNLEFERLTKAYKEFAQKIYNLRVLYTSYDKEKICQLIFGQGLMLSHELIITFEEPTRKGRKTTNNMIGWIDIYLNELRKIYNQKFRAVIECKYKSTDINRCMEQVEDYELPLKRENMMLPVVRMCINFEDGYIEDIVAYKYNSADNKLLQKLEYHAVSKPYQCEYPGCTRSFKTNKSLISHKGSGHTKKENKNL